MIEPHVLILGAGPAGLAAAFQLVQRRLARVTVLEKNNWIGGIAGSFEISGIHLDYGSHRLHPSCDPEILHDIKALLGDKLLDRPRHGRIRLRGRWIHFPLNPLDLILQLPPGFALGSVKDMVGKYFTRNLNPHEEQSFASVLEVGLGKTICHDFYFPYARKIWGIPPEELSVTQARRRISANSSGKMFRKIISALPGIKKTSRSGRFFYPCGGFGQICESLYKAARNARVEFNLGNHVKYVQLRGKKVYTVTCESVGQTNTYEADYIWSTIPICGLVQSFKPDAPTSVVNACKNIEYRAMILIYLLLEQDHFSEYDAHYFPEPDIRITRISEPKNYSNAREPQNLTILCAELPCFTTDTEWSMTNDELKKLVCNCLDSVGIPVKVSIKDVITHRLPQAYPIYRQGYETYFEQIDQWLGQIENLITFGRQGLFAHDNTHHALYMGYAAAKCLKGNGHFDRTRWNEFRQIFDTHVVED